MKFVLIDLKGHYFSTIVKSPMGNFLRGSNNLKDAKVFATRKGAEQEIVNNQKLKDFHVVEVEEMGPFTPGPWIIDNGDSNILGVFNLANGEAICYFTENMSEPLSNDKPNAHLISQAPEMFQALEHISKELKKGVSAPTAYSLFQMAESVLKKAKGL